MMILEESSPLEEFLKLIPALLKEVFDSYIGYVLVVGSIVIIILIRFYFWISYKHRKQDVCMDNNQYWSLSQGCLKEIVSIENGKCPPYYTQYNKQCYLDLFKINVLDQVLLQKNEDRFGNYFIENDSLRLK